MGPPVSDFIAREARFGTQNYEPLGVVLSRGEGVFVWDTQSGPTEFFDFTSLIRLFERFIVKIERCAPGSSREIRQ